MTSSTSNFSSTESALYFVEDIMDRAMIPFFLLGEVARSVVDDLDRDPTTPIEVGMRRTDYTEYARETLKMFLPPDAVFTSKSIDFEWQGTPVKVRIIDRNYSFLQNLDSVFYKITSFKIPNPFEKYWKVRGVLK